MDHKFAPKLQDALIKVLESGVAMAKMDVMNNPMAVARFMNQMQQLAWTTIEPNTAMAEDFLAAIWED